MFHSVPGVPRVKMERFGTCNLLFTPAVLFVIIAGLYPVVLQLTLPHKRNTTFTVPHQSFPANHLYLNKTIHHEPDKKRRHQTGSVRPV
jgi:hypothetical protein